MVFSFFLLPSSSMDYLIYSTIKFLVRNTSLYTRSCSPFVLKPSCTAFFGTRVVVLLSSVRYVPRTTYSPSDPSPRKTRFPYRTTCILYWHSDLEWPRINHPLPLVDTSIFTCPSILVSVSPSKVSETGTWLSTYKEKHERFKQRRK